MQGYCAVFGKIIGCLKDGRAPHSSKVDQRIRESWRDRDAKLFLTSGGSAQYALEYLLDVLGEILLRSSGNKLLGERLAHLPQCMNDFHYDILRERLLDNKDYN
jgi:hypothetical protein